MEEKIIAYKSIILNTHLNTTFVANESDSKTLALGEKYELVGELDVPAYDEKFYKITQCAIFQFCRPFNEITEEMHKKFIDLISFYND